MSINKVKSGSYQARIKLSTGKIVTKCFKKKVAAIQWEKERLHDSLLGRYDYLNVNRSLGEACQEWLDRKIIGQKTRSTTTSYSTSVTKYINPLLGVEKLSGLSEVHADVFIKLLQEKKLTPRTINRHLLVLKMILNFCVYENWISKSPFNRVRNLKVQNKGFNFLNRSEISRLLNANRDNQPVYALLLIALNTGLRSGEICGLCWDAIDFDTGLIHIKRSMSKYGLNDRTKTNQIRFIPMNSTLKSYFNKIRRNKTHEVFIIVDKNGKPFDPSHISNRLFKKARELAEVKNVRFHDLRHTYASHFMMNNGNVYELQKILGHTKIDMTQKYAHLSPGHLIKAVNTVQFSATSENEFPDSFQSRLKVVK